MRPSCPNCGWSNTRPSFRAGILDLILAALLLKPFRCKSCNRRFFRFKYSWARFVVPAAVLLIAVIIVTGVATVKQLGEERHRRVVNAEQGTPTR